MSSGRASGHYPGEGGECRLHNSLPGLVRYDPNARHLCPACGKLLEYLVAGPRGDAPPGSVEAEEGTWGLCSPECVNRYFKLLDDEGRPVCLCGAPVTVYGGAECFDCARFGFRPIETEERIYKEQWIHHGEP